MAEKETTCFCCGTVYDPWRKEARIFERGRCPRCKWRADEVATDEEQPRHILLTMLVERAVTGNPPEVQRDSRGFVRIVATARECALLEHGDQIQRGEDIWRITSITDEVIWMRSMIAVEVGEGQNAYVTISAGKTSDRTED